jgi:hypothetical protein
MVISLVSYRALCSLGQADILSNESQDSHSPGPNGRISQRCRRHPSTLHFHKHQEPFADNWHQQIFKALHAAYHDALCNPFLQQSPLLFQDPRTEQVAQLLSHPENSGSLRLRLDKVAEAANLHLASQSTE